MAQWRKDERTVRFLLGRGRLESFEAGDLAGLAEAQLARAARRPRRLRPCAWVTWMAPMRLAYDAYRMAAEALLARQGLRATEGDGSHMAVEDAVSAQFAADILVFAKPTSAL